jgi:tetratricopeptide (TPR) repeat protein
VTSNKESFKSFYREGARLLHRGEILRATEILQKAHRMRSDHPETAINLSGAYILSKKFREAANVLEPLSESVSDNEMVWINLGAAYLGNPVLATEENQQQAIKAFKRALDINPIAPSVAYNIALIYKDRRDTELAKHWFRQALEANPSDKDAQSQLSRLEQNP